MEKKTIRKKLKEIQQEPKKKGTWKVVLISIPCIIIQLLAIIVSLFWGLRISGEKSLYDKVDKEKPQLVVDKEEETVGELIIDLDGGIGDVTVDDTINSDENGGGDSAGNNSQGGNDNTNNGNTENPVERPTEKPTEKPTYVIPSDSDEYDVLYNGEKYVYNDDVISLLFLGIDTPSEVKPAEDSVSGGQSDAIYLMVLNPDTKIMDIIAIHRDSIAIIDVYNPDGTHNVSGYAQICLQHAYGDGMELSNERAKKAVSRMLYNLPIHSVTSINMGAIADLNDAVGGVTLDVLHDIDAYGYKFTKGDRVTLKGMEAYAYLRFRDLYRHYTAAERLERQKQYINLFIEKAISELKKDVGKVIDIYDIVKKYVVTDLELNEMTYLASEIIGYDFGGIYTLKGEVNTKWKYERYYLDEAALYEMIIDKFYEKVD